MQIKHLVKSIAAMSLVLFSVSLLALPLDKDKPRHKAMRKAMKTYLAQQILPVLRQKRAVLDTKISAEDQQKIVTLRAKLKALKADKKDWRKDLRELRKQGISTTAQRQEFQQMHQDITAVMQDAKIMAQKYEAAINELLNPLEAQKEQWKKEMKEIHEKYKNAQPDSTQHKGRHGKGRHEGRHRGLGQHHFKALQPVAFLLMSADENDSSFRSLMEEEKQPAATAPTNIYPNPTTTQSTIEFTTAIDGVVQVEILDSNGKVVKTVLNEKRSAGTHKIQLDVTDLTQPMYLYKITTPDRVEVQKLLIR